MLEAEGIDAEVIDLRSIKPWDQETVIESVRRTGRAVVCDSAWRTAGASAEIAATIGAEAFRELRAPVERVALPDTPAPVASSEESAYYPDETDIVRAAQQTFGRERVSRQGAAA